MCNRNGKPYRPKRTQTTALAKPLRVNRPVKASSSKSALKDEALKIGFAAFLALMVGLFVYVNYIAE